MTHSNDLCDFIDGVAKSIGKNFPLLERFGDPDLKHLICCCQKYRETTASSAFDLASVVELSYRVAKSYQKSPTSLDYSGGGLNREKFLRLMRFVGRVRTCYHTFLEAAGRFPSFQQIDLIFDVPLATASRVPASLKIPFPKDIEGFPEASKMNSKKIADIRSRYDDLCDKKLHVHAEIGFLFRLLTEEGNLSRIFPYIGISKLSCFLCHHMLIGVGIFQSRGSHGVLETQWTLPRSFELNPHYREIISSSFLKLQTRITEDSRSFRMTRLNRKPQSEAVVSDCISLSAKVELAARMEPLAKAREDQAEAAFWERHDSKR